MSTSSGESGGAHGSPGKCVATDARKSQQVGRNLQWWPHYGARDARSCASSTVACEEEASFEASAHRRSSRRCNNLSRIGSRALAAGIPPVHLAEMSAILQGRPRRLEELPRKVPPRVNTETALDESDEEDLLEEAGTEGNGAVVGGGSGSQLEQALLKLTAIADKLVGPKEKSHKIDHLLDGGVNKNQNMNVNKYNINVYIHKYLYVLKSEFIQLHVLIYLVMH